MRLAYLAGIALLFVLATSGTALAQKDTRVLQQEARRYKEGKALLKTAVLPRKADVIHIKCPWKRQDKHCNLMRRSWKHWDRENWGSALKFSAQALLEKPRSLEAIHGIAEALFRLEGCSPALEYIQLAASPDWVGTKAVSNLVYCNLSLSSTPRDNQQTKRFAQLGVAHSSAWNWYALAYMATSRGEYPLATRYIEELVKHMPTSKGHILAAAIYKDMERLDDALHHLETSLTLAERPEHTSEALIDMIALHFSRLEYVKAKAIVDRLAAQNNKEDALYIRQWRAAITSHQGNVKAAINLVEDTEIQSRYLFRKHLIARTLEKFPENRIPDLVPWEQLALAFFMGESDQAVEKARTMHQNGEIGSGTLDYALFTGGECGIAAMTSTTKYGGSIADKEEEFQFKGYWRRRCGRKASSGSFNTHGMPAFWARQVTIGWMAGVNAYYSNGPRALSEIGKVTDEDSGALHRVALWTHAAFGERDQVTKHFMIAKSKGVIDIEDYWAFMFSAIRSEDMKQAIEDFENLPQAAKIPLIWPEDVGRMRRVIRAAAERDPAFAARLVDTYMVLDGPLERSASKSVSAVPTTLTRR